MSRAYGCLWRNVLVALLVVGTLSGCSTDEREEYVERPVEELYNSSMDALLGGDFVVAAERFDEVERQHPYSVWATKAQLMGAYAHYQADEYDEAIAALRRYIELHPGNPDVAYAYYLAAIAYYEQISDVGRDQSVTRRARSSLEAVVRRFPGSDYANDARLKLDLTRDHLAGKEMSVGRFYLRQGHLLAAINRFRIVADEYQTTSHVPEALHRLAEAYTAVGLDEEAVRVAAVLQHNYPGNEWYVDSYSLVEKGESGSEDGDEDWFSRNWDAVFDPEKVIGGGGGRAEELAKELEEKRAAEDEALKERARLMERERTGGTSEAPQQPAQAPPAAPKG